VDNVILIRMRTKKRGTKYVVARNIAIIVVVIIIAYFVLKGVRDILGTFPR